MSEDLDSFIATIMPRHQRLTPMVISIFEGILQSQKVDFLSVEGRTKLEDGVREKQNRKQYKDMRSEFTDATGIRIITFLNSDVTKIEDIIKRTFEIDVSNSLDRSGALGTDKVGYRSVHYVCLLGDTRVSNLEYEGLCDLKFKVQIRTVLQHAWAELAHDRSYKFGAALPPDLERRLNLYSGLLEIADRGFEELSSGIDAYTREVNTSPPEEWTARSIDSITLARFVEQFATSHGIILNQSVKPDESAKNVGELQEFGLHSIAELNAITSEAGTEKWLKKLEGLRTTPIGLLRCLMMAHDINGYFTRVKLDCTVINRDLFELMVSIWGKEKVKAILTKWNIKIIGRRGGISQIESE